MSGSVSVSVRGVSTSALPDVRDGLGEGPPAVPAHVLLAVVLVHLGHLGAGPAAQAAARVLEGRHDDREGGADA